MNPTDPVRPESFFAELLVPLSRVNARRGVRYLGDASGVASHWTPVVSRTGGLERLSTDHCSADALIEQLGAYWLAQGDTALAKLSPYLVALRREIVASRPQTPATPAYVPMYVYPLF
jgi:hypothetical protein